MTARFLTPQLAVTNLDVPIDNLPSDLDGMTIAHLSDLHFGRGGWFPIHFRRTLDTVQTLDPDVIVNTGDFMYKWPPASTFRSDVEAIAALGIPRVSILGNHDYYGGPEPACDLIRTLRDTGETALFNEPHEVRHGSAALTFVGLDDDNPESRFERGIDRLLAAPRPRIALIHEPDLAERLPPDSADLVLAGHTHGGQIALPGLRPWIVRHFCGSGYVEGSYVVNGNRMYVNRGLGCVGLPLRFRAAPELAAVRLRRV